MSDKEENSNDEKKTRTNQDEGSRNLKIITEGNVSLYSSDKNTDNSGAIAENVPIEGAGDDKEHILLDNLELDKIEAELTGMSKEIINTDAGKDAGDYTDKAKVSAIDVINIEDLNIEIDTKVSKTNVTVKKDESNDTSVDKCNEKEPKKADDLDEIEDDDMELRWDDDDDDASNHAMGDDNGNADTKNDDILSEDQLLDDPSDVLTKDMTETPSDGNPKVSEANLDSDVLKINSEENSLTRDDNTTEIETTKESEISPKLDIPKDEKILVDMRLEENYLNTEEINSPETDFSAEESMDRDDINVLEEKLLEESENTEEINSPEMDFSAEESMDRDDINVLEDKLLEEYEIVTEATVIAPAKEILEEKSMDEPIKETESAKTNLLTEVTNDEQTKEDLVAIIEEDKLLAKSKSNTEAESSTLNLKSFTDIILNKDNDDIMSEKLLEESDSKDESSLIISEKVIECSKIVPEKEAPMNKEDNDDALLEEKLLQETETAEIIPESDITMDVDNEEEGELLKDVESPEDSCTPMDVDNTDTSNGDQAKVEDKIIDKTMNQFEVAKKAIILPIEDQPNIEKVEETTDEVKNMDQSDDQNRIIEKVIDQPIKDTSKAVDIIKDTPIEDEVKIDEEIVDQAVSEKERIDQQIDDQTKMKDGNKDQLILESNTKEQSIKSPVQTDALTVSNTLNILVEDLEKPIPEETTLVTEIKIKTDPEQFDTDLDKPEKSKEMISPDTSLDNNKEVDDISFSNNSSIFLEVSCPIKTDHGVHKPDVMLEIPTQELIDMDDTDLSMNLDHSVMIDDDVKNVDDDIVHDKTIDETVVDDVIGSDKIVTDNAKVSKKSVEQANVVKDTIKEKPVDQKVFATESTVLDKIIAEDNTEKPVDQKAIDTEMTTVDKIIADEDTVKEKSVVQEAIVTESTVGEVQTVSNIVESDKKVEDTVVQATVEENMEKLFADDELEVAKEIAECIASTSQVQVPAEQPPASITRMTPDTSDEVPEIDDSLGLLAESAGRMMEDDEEPDDDFDGDDDDDFDHDGEL